MHARPGDTRSGSFGSFTFVSPLHPTRELIRAEGDRFAPAGRLASDADQPPPGTRLFENRRANMWWVRDERGRIVLACSD